MPDLKISMGVVRDSLHVWLQKSTPSASNTPSKFKGDIEDALHVRLQQSISHDTLHPFRIHGRCQTLCTSDYNNWFPQGCYKRCFPRPNTTFKYPLSKTYTHLGVAGAPPYDFANLRERVVEPWDVHLDSSFTSRVGARIPYPWPGMVLCDAEHNSKSMDASSRF